MKNKLFLNRNLRNTICISLFFLIALSDIYGQNSKYARQVLDALCSPKMEGRGYVRNGERKAAEYIAKEWKKMKVKPLLPKNDYFQTFSISANTLPDKMNCQIGDKKMSSGTDYLVHPDSPTSTGSFEISYIDMRLLKDTLALFTAIQTTGNKVIAFKEYELTEKKEKEFLYAVIDGIKFAQENIGIPAILLLTTDKLTWYPASEQANIPVFIVKKESLPKEASSISFDITAQFYPNYTSQNVIGVIRGKTYPDSILLFTAHYDHLGRMGSEIYFPGANDNASGVAMLLNIAKYYSVHRPDKTLVFIAFGAEEIGLKGSLHFVSKPPIELKNINFMLNLDILGTGDDGITVVNGTVFKGLFADMVKMNEENKWLKEVRVRGEMCKSDHCPLYKKGVPAFYIYTMGGIAEYHNIFDKSETLPLTKFDDLLKLLIHFTEKLQKK